MNEDRRRRNLLLFSLPVIVLLCYGTASLHFSYTPDDTYIYLQFARNVDQGNGVAFNAGEPTYGITSPLWMLIIALGGRLGVDLYLAAKAIDLVLASLGLIALYLLAYEIIRDVGVALCATVAFSVNAWFLRWSGSGMETSLSVLLTLVTLLFCLRNEYVLAVVFAGLLTLTRPEGALLVGVIVADLCVNSFDGKRAIRMSLSLLITYALLLAPWLIYAFATFGTAIPNTALGKMGWSFSVGEIVSTFRDVLQTLLAADAVAISVFLAAGVWLFVYWRRKGADEPGPGRAVYLFRQSLGGVAWAVGLPLFYIASGTNVVSRYLLMATPLITIYAFSFLFELFSLSPWRSRANLAVMVLTGLIMLQNQLFYHRYVVPGVEAFEQGMETCLIPIGQWIGEHTPAASIVVTGDIGAIGFYSGRRICDTGGLVSPLFLPFIQRGVPPYEIIQRGLYRPLCPADYVVHRALIPEELKSEPDLIPLLTKPFPNMSLTDSRIVYYTLYRVRSSEPADTLSAGRQ